jgi:cytoskeleton protein RodZ
MAFFNRLKTPFADDPPGGNAAPAFDSIVAGDILRQQRERLGLDLADVAAVLRIKPAYLAALEQGRPDELPGAVYAVGFMRAYAEHLGLDGGEILRRFKQASAGLTARPDLGFPMQLGERSMPGGGVLLVAVILAICAYGTWYYLSTDERSRPERVPEVPALLLPKPEPGRTESAAAQAQELLAALRTTAPAAGRGPSEATDSGSDLVDRPATLPAVSTPLPSPVVIPAQTAAIAPAAGPEGASNAADAPAQIVIHAAADSWVEIRDATRSVLLRRVLKIGESYRVPDRPGLSLRTGNAGGLEVTVDGNPVPPLGRMGAVRRNVVLDPRALIAGTAVRQ